MQSNTLVDWVHTYADLVADQSACWVCTELPLSTSASLPWRISPASVSYWTWLQKQWNSKHPLWSATWTDIYAGAKQWYDHPRPLSSYSVSDGSECLTAEAVELAGPVPLCIKNFKGQAQVGWTQMHILGHCRVVQNDAWAALPTRTLWVGGPHEWPYYMGIGLAVVPRGGLMTCALAVCC